jgi:hypothetical protein
VALAEFRWQDTFLVPFLQPFPPFLEKAFNVFEVVLTQSHFFLVPCAWIYFLLPITY